MNLTSKILTVALFTQAALGAASHPQVKRLEVPGNEDARYFMPYSLAIEAQGGKTIYLAGINAAPMYHSHPHIAKEFDAVPLDAAGQTEEVIQALKDILAQAGGGLENIVQMTIHVVDVEANGDAIQNVTGKHFGTHTPASTVVEVPGIITDPRLLLELTAIAVIPEAEQLSRQAINPWNWSEAFSYNQGELVTGTSKELILAGQTSVDAQGQPLAKGDIRAQISKALDNIETVLEQADMSMSDLASVTIYTTDIDAVMQNFDVYNARMAAAGVKPPQTLIGVQRLALPELMIEIVATARQ